MKKKLERQGGLAKNILAVTSDMTTGYLPGVKENFPNVEQIIDKFHVKQVLIKALDEVRKQEQKATDDKQERFQHRYFFMTPRRQMTEEQLSRLTVLSKSFPKTGRAFRIVQALYEFYFCNSMKEAERQFK